MPIVLIGCTTLTPVKIERYDPIDFKNEVSKVEGDDAQKDRYIELLEQGLYSVLEKFYFLIEEVKAAEKSRRPIKVIDELDE